MRVLIVEDEQELADSIGLGLRQQGYAADVVYDGEQALIQAEVNSYDLVILDLNLPKLDGMEVCRRLRASEVPTGILMLTARTSLSDRVSGLDQGADDYLVKPFHFSELLARIRALLRRGSQFSQPILRIGELVLDPNALKGFFNGKELQLTVKEFAILEYLMRNAGRIVGQEELLEHVWDDQANLFTHTVKVHIKNIRKKLDTVGGSGVLATIRGKGYSL